MSVTQNENSSRTSIDGPSPGKPESRLAIVLPTAAILLLASSVLLVRYLPMTDLPLHFAIVSVLENYDDPSYGFTEYYEIAAGRTLYLMPYLIIISLARFMPIEFATRCLLFLALIAFPLAALAWLRSRGRPAIFALLTLPLMYNATIFWGFFHFNLATGMALFSFLLFARPRRTLLTDVALALLCALITITHLYGLLLVFGFAFFWILVENPIEALARGRAELFRRLSPLLPGIIGALIWLSFASGAPGVDTTQHPPLIERLVGFENSVLGGYRDWSETVVLAAFGSVFLLFSFHALPVTRKRWSLLAREDRALYAYIVFNLFLYLVLPLNIPTAKCIYFRHAVLACLFAPLVMPAALYRRYPRTGKTLLIVLAFVAITNSWLHLLHFNLEARSFDNILARIPQNPRLIALNFERNGRISQSNPYLHYAAYVQAIRGGYTAVSFATFAWMSPVREKKQAKIPTTPDAFEWKPELYSYKDFGYYYDHVLVCGYTGLDARGIEFPYYLVHETYPWRLFRKIPTEGK